MSLLSIIILAKDEERNLPHCLSSVENLDAEIFIVDSGSRDRTLEIAQKNNCRIFNHPFENYAKQLNWALENLPIETPWVMRLDADERLTAGLVEELKQALPQCAAKISAFEMKRRVYFWSSWIRHGGYYPTWLLRVWRTGLARCEDRWMDEHMVLSQGKIARLENDLIDENHKGLTFWTDKHNRYADREVLDLIELETKKTQNNISGQASRKRWMKENLYAKSPLFLRTVLYWFYRYFILLGFLDGLPGLVFHFLQGFWYRFLIDAKIYELRSVKRNQQ